MQAFTAREAKSPAKRAPATRRKDFDEIYKEFAAAKGREQASRCAQCGVPFCQSACPLHNNIPDWLLLAAEGRMEEAYAVSSETNMMPEVCGRICPQDRLCEGDCVIEQSTHGAVTIGAVERWITETAFENGWVKPARPHAELTQSVGVVGAGPAGLAAAELLRREGYQVTVYDRYDRVGGLLVYGIPNFKLDKHVVARRQKLLEESGVQFVMNWELGRDGDLKDLRAKHDAVLLAFGVYAARALTVPVDAEAHPAMAMDFLTVSNRRGFGDAVPEELDAKMNADAKRVIVVGGGDTAMDCVRTAVRQGATEVTCLYRRDRVNMPGSAREVTHAEQEGVVFEFLAAPKAVKKSGDHLEVRAARMRLGAPDASGRQSPEEIPGEDFTIKADLVIQALGFEPEDVHALCGGDDLTLAKPGTLRVDAATMATSMDGVFAAGDVVRGASLVVWAIKDGMTAAEAIAKWLAAKVQTKIAVGA